jgi:DNA-binding CsgD family transcriptional regulator/tetratricopeptide (TPR) repeat protein
MSRPGALLERSTQLATLAEIWTSTRQQGRGRTVFVGGEAGSGKTTLVSSFCESAPGSPTVAVGACDALSISRPLGPFLDLGYEFGSESGPLHSGGRADEVVSALLAELGRRGPTIIVLEDLHWADEATIDVVRLMTRRIRSRPGLVIGTYRDDEVDRSHPLRVLLGELPELIDRVRVSSFSEQTVVELATESGLDGHEIYLRTGGNPFFVTEVLSAASDVIPDSVRDAVLARFTRLGPDGRRVLEAAAVVPPSAETWLLAAMVGQIGTGVQQGLASGIVLADGARISYRHDLSRLAVLESIDPDRIRNLHLSAVAALADPPSGVLDVARLAYHAVAADDGPAVLRYAPAAGSQAAAVGAHREAAMHYANALPYRSNLDPSSAASLLEAHAIECLLGDRAPDAVPSAKEAAAVYGKLGDKLGQAGALVRLSTIQRAIGDVGASTRSAHEALSVLETVEMSAPLALAYATVAQLSMCIGDSEESILAAERALTIAGAIGDEETAIHANVSIGALELEDPVTAARGRARLLSAVERAQKAGFEDQVGRAFNNLVYGGFSTFQLDEADRWLRQATDYHSQHESGLWLSFTMNSSAELAMLRGRWEEASDLANRVLSRSGTPLVRFGALTTIGLIRARRGDPDPWGPLDEALGIAKQTGELQVIVPVVSARAEAAWLEGNSEQIRQETESPYRQVVIAEFPWALGEMAYWRWQAGLDTEVLDWDRSPRRAQMSGDAAEAADLWQRLGYPYEAALAMFDTGDEAFMRKSLEILRALGASATVAVVARRLRKIGAKGLPRGPRTSTVANSAGLTRRELEVMMLVTQGLRDAEIASRLYLSEKTVGHHVSAVLRKLQVKNRVQVAAEAKRRGLATDL